MERITIDASLPAKLPTVDMSEWEPITPDVSDEELERRAKSNEKRYTFDEVRARLRSLEQQT